MQYVVTEGSNSLAEVSGEHCQRSYNSHRTQHILFLPCSRAKSHSSVTDSKAVIVEHQNEIPIVNLIVNVQVFIHEAIDARSDKKLEIETQPSS